MASLSDARVKQLLESGYIASFATHNPNGSIHIANECRRLVWIEISLPPKSPCPVERLRIWGHEPY